ncbi:MAG: YkgJ family cysteine cluster protein [Flavobacteriales bacterium]|nr:YkgJ family cysteine cluster protein [Flavobacteriales bacterium]
MPTNIKDLKQKALLNKKENNRFFEKLKKENNRVLDDAFRSFHQEVFSVTNCLNCANCCKTTGPLFTVKDIERIAKHLKMKAGDFVQNYLHKDEDDDMVLNQLPCVFLQSDNTCRIYEVRPKACEEYPHTNRKNMKEILNITYLNISVCPAVFDIVDKMKKQIKI